MAIMHLRFAGGDTLKGYQHLSLHRYVQQPTGMLLTGPQAQDATGPFTCCRRPALSLTRPISSVMIAYRHPGNSAIFIVMTDTGSEFPFIFRPVHWSITHSAQPPG